ncbi:Spx/MgsR family RNA polymerase-binding regulatory protein [Mycoplasmoides pirum]|uniref:Spx/MgsR family RNA polymerase-binding regulatory protein n=1 Tax=Mycoplasmoides pirum TaxID=2122 RepID=UPI000A823763|nr:Spx/MgsR family RNA polymerase-binding regulatory protein [Mycoplasmoides pirum]
MKNKDVSTPKKDISSLVSSDAGKTLLLITTSCSSCVRTKKFFIDNKLPFIEINFYTLPITEKHFKDILSLTDNGVFDVISTNSKYLSNNKVDIGSLKISELIDLIHKHPSIVKRPIILQYDKSGIPKRLMIGYNSVDIRVFLRPIKEAEFHKSDLSYENPDKYFEFLDDISPVKFAIKKAK